MSLVSQITLTDGSSRCTSFYPAIWTEFFPVRHVVCSVAEAFLCRYTLDEGCVGVLLIMF